MDLDRGICGVAAGLMTLLLMAAPGCDPDSGFNAIKDYDNVVTLRDYGTDFGAFQTYAMPDSVVDLVFPPDPEVDNISSDFNPLILEEISDRLAMLGYTRIDPSMEDPDFYVLVSVTNQMWFEFPYRTWWWSNWGWFGDWPGWGEGSDVEYPDHYFGVDFVFPNGTLLIDMVDSRDPAADPTVIPCIWTAVLNGVLTNTTVNTDRRLDINITKAFDQSPYLGAD